MFPLLLAAGCSSVPDFRPTKPIEEASSFSEALDLCLAYRIEGVRNTAGRAMPARAVVLVPWTRCFGDVLRKFPEGQADSDFVAFFRALRARHDAIQPPDAEVIDWEEMNAVVSITGASFKKTVPAARAYSAKELAAIRRQLPAYSLYLIEGGRAGKRQARGSAGRTDPEILELRRFAGAGGAGGPAGAARTRGRKDAGRAFCVRFHDFRELVTNLEELSRYRDILTEHDQDGQRVRVEEKIQVRKKEARALREELEKREKEPGGARRSAC